MIAYSQKQLSSQSPNQAEAKNNSSLADSNYQRARLAVQKGKLAEAIPHYQQTLKHDPQHLIAHQELGNIFLKQEQWLKAITCYHQALEIDPNLPQIHHNLGETYAQLEQWSQAISSYQQAIQLKPDYSWSHNNLGDIFLKQQKWIKAIVAYQEAIQLNPNFSWSHHNLGKACLMLQQWSEAVTACQKAIELGCDSCWSYYNLAEAFFYQYKWSEAITAYDQALALKDDLPQAKQRLNYARHQNVKSKLELAQAYYWKAIEQEPDNIELYHKALELQPTNAQLYLALGQTLQNQGEFKEAVKAYKKAISFNPNWAEAYGLLAEVLTVVGQTSEALEARFQGLTLEPSFVAPEDHLALGNQLQEIGKLEQAIICYQRVLKFNPNLVEAYNSLGKALTQQQQWDKAIDCYQQGIQQFPEQVEFYQDLGKVWRQQGQWAQAISTYQQAIELQDKDWEIYHDYGDACLNLERWQEAIDCYQKAIELNPELTWSYWNLGIAYSQLGDREKVWGFFEKIEGIDSSFLEIEGKKLGQKTPKNEAFKRAFIDYRQGQSFPIKTLSSEIDLENVFQENNEKSSENRLNFRGKNATFKVDDTKDIEMTVIRSSNQGKGKNQTVDYYLEKGDSLRKKERWEEALQCYQKVIELEPKNWLAHHHLGDVSLSLEQYENAIDLYSCSLDLNPNFFWSYYNLGVALCKLGRYEEAFAAHQKVEEINPNFWEMSSVDYSIQHQIGDFWFEQKRWQEAIVAYQRSLTLNPHSDWSANNLGKVLYGLERWEEACDKFQQALKVNPTLQEAQYYLDQTLAQLGRLDEINSDQQAVEVSLNFPETNGKVLEKIQESQPTRKRQTPELSSRDNLSIACLTIVSKNYLPQARVLCDSFLEYHPGAQFFVFLVDKVDGYFDPTQEQFKILTFEDVDFPSLETFPYHYNILELNTAVKPFVLRYLLKQPEIEKLTYIDPDIQIFRRLDEVWNGLENHSVVLTPHMRQPFKDNHSPSEVQILQSGTYNLGFIGLKSNESSLELLYWWMEKLYLDCVVDIPNGLFVDQKWMDLIPGYFPDTYILHDPSYNIAYWNLHERTVEKVEERYWVEKQPLAFFHFSGYSPKNRSKLSKHQARHQLVNLPLVKELCDGYGDRLMQFGYEEARSYPFAYGKLSNGIKVNNQMNYVIRQYMKKNLPFPNPEQEADEFCQFLMTPSPFLTGINRPPLVTAIFHDRPDVAAYFSNAVQDFKDEGFMYWLMNQGAKELGIEDLCQRFKRYLYETNIVEDVINVLKKRTDVTAAYPNFVSDRQSYQGLCGWLENSGVKEEKLNATKLEAFKQARGGYYKVLNLYFLRPDLQLAFCNIHLPEIRASFIEWLKSNLADLQNLDLNECLWFDFVCEQQPEKITIVNLLYNCQIRKLMGGDASLFELDKLLQVSELGQNQDIKKAVIEFFVSSEAPPPLSQLEAFYKSQGILNHLFPKAFESREKLSQFFDYIKEHSSLHSLPLQVKAVAKWLDQLDQEINKYDPTNTQVVNVAGHFDAATGMGQSARSMRQTLEAAGINYSAITLPSIHIHKDAYFEKENQYLLMGWPLAGQGVNITIVNADSVRHVTEILMSCYWQGRKNIGYWVWETEDLPHSQAKSDINFDEIWTPSEYSAAAIRKSVEIPVKVIPHVLHFKELNTIESKRSEFGLPEDQLLFGFFFDQKSGLERKNPYGLIQAFRQAFAESKDACLVLKVSSPLPGNYDYEMLKLETIGLNVIWIEETFDRAKTLRLMHCLDVYVSLHRSEGFGLTMAEAMAMGKPVIATKYSGNIDFMDEENSLLVKADVIESERSYGPYLKGTRWASPDLHQAAEYMKHLKYENLRLKYSQLSNKSIKAKLSPEIVKTMLRLT